MYNICIYICVYKIYGYTYIYVYIYKKSMYIIISYAWKYVAQLKPGLPESMSFVWHAFTPVLCLQLSVTNVTTSYNQPLTYLASRETQSL